MRINVVKIVQEYEEKLNNVSGVNERIQVLNDYSTALRNIDLQHAHQLAKEAFEMAASIQNVPLKALSLKNLAFVDMLQSDFDGSIYKANEAKQIFIDLGDIVSEISTNEILGNTFIQLSNYGRALEYFFINLELSRKVDDNICRSTALANLGIAYQRLGEYDRALEHFKDSQEINIALDYKQGLGIVYNNMGMVQYQQKKFDLALENWEKGLEALKILNDKIHESNTLLNIGRLYIDTANYAEAEKCLERALKIKDRLGERYDITTAYNHLGLLFQQQKDFSKALTYYKKALANSESLKAKALLFETHKNLSFYYETVGAFKQALEHYEWANEFQKEIFNEEMTKKTKSIELRYEIDRIAKEKEKEIYRLRNIELAKANEQILLQKVEIEEKNKSITDSIRYAKRIQEAILPPKPIVEQYLSDSFIFYKPKDIVSGDFYWLEQWGNQVFIAAVDCTGHGVPGAFMSLLGYNLLNQAVSVLGLTKPSLILNQINRGLMKMLHQQSMYSQAVTDGMDIALCAINFKQYKIEFSGAFNPLWVFHEGQFIETTSNKFSIGTYNAAQPQMFTNHTLDLKQGDTIYIFTDGYADQFGGPKGKKFKYQQMKDLLFSIQHLPMSVQREHIENAFDSWKGELEQVDDVLVIGVRI